MRITALLLLALGLGVATPASAAPSGRVCDDHEGMTKVLADRYGEVLTARGFADDSGASYILELHANGETGTWTALARYATDRSCILNAGEMWDLVPPVPPGADM